MNWFPLTSGSDPVPGDPRVVAQVARDYDDVAVKITAAAQRLRAIGAPSVTMSQATDAVKVQAVKVAGDVERARRRYSVAGEALGEYATRLAVAQGHAADALAEASAAASALDDLTGERRFRQSKVDDARRAAAADGADLRAATDVAGWLRRVGDTQAEIAVAETRLQRARDRVPGIQTDARRAADVARDRIGRVVDSDGLNSSFWDRVGQVAIQVTKVVAVVSEAVAQVAGVLSLVCLFVPVL